MPLEQYFQMLEDGALTWADQFHMAEERRSGLIARGSATQEAPPRDPGTGCRGFQHTQEDQRWFGFRGPQTLRLPQQRGLYAARRTHYQRHFVEARVPPVLGCGSCLERLPFGALWHESLIDQILYITDFDADR
jgi:hypothetical protein